MEEQQTISIAPLLGRLIEGSKGPKATAEEIAAAIALTFDNRLSHVQCAALLTALSSTGRAWDSDVIAECASQMRTAGAQTDRKLLNAVLRKRARREGSYKGGLCDLVGTGGDGHSTFNVSTTASVIASTLLLIAKHGARASSSRSGAADLLQSVAPRGPKIEAVTAATLAQVYEGGGSYAFLYAPTFHPGMRHALAVRKELGFRTIFNVLGPLANPVDWAVEARICGVAKAELGPRYAEALGMNGVKKAMVVCGKEQLDEISCAGPTSCWRLRERPNPEHKGTISQDDEDFTTSDEDAPPRSLVDVVGFDLQPSDFGFPCHPLSEVGPGKAPAENAELLIRILKNEVPSDDPVLQFVLMNAAALFVVSGICDAEHSDMGTGDSGKVVTEVGPGGGRWKEGVRRARWALKSGQALKSLDAYIDFTNSI